MRAFFEKTKIFYTINILFTCICLLAYVYLHKILIKYIFTLNYSLIDLVKLGKRLDFSLVFDVDTPNNGSIVKVGYSFFT